jgi:outer membrane protein TolC
LAEVGLLRCEALEAQGRDPLAALAQTEAQALAADRADGDWRTQLLRARAALLRARWTPDPGARPAYLHTADQEATRAMAQAGRIPATLVMAAQVQLAWAKQEPRGAQTRRVLARRALQACLGMDPGYRPALQILATVAPR